MFRFAAAGMQATLVLVLVGAFQWVISREAVNPASYDFRVVYCGERAIAHHLDPYTVEPLRTCEHATRPEATESTWSVTPYPLPGYAGAALLPLAFLPFKLAKLLWMLALVASFITVCVAVSEIAKMRAWTVAGILAPTLGYLNFAYGEPVDIAVCAVALSALALHRQKPVPAALAAATAMLEPTIGLPACAALAFLVPSARLPLAACGVAAVSASLVALGFGRTLEYVSVFLPAHAHSELYAVDQYSLAHVLVLAGVPAAVAIKTGMLAYFVAIIVGILSAMRFVKLEFSRGLLVLLPVATAMFGGSFVHDVEIAAALPAAIVLAERSGFARVAVSLLSMQWGYPLRSIVVLVSASAASLSSWIYARQSLLRRGGYAVAVVAFILVLNALLSMPPRDIRDAGAPPIEISATTPSSLVWEWAIRLSPAASDRSNRGTAQKIPLWIALGILPISLFELQLVALAGRRRNDVASDSPILAG